MSAPRKVAILGAGFSGLTVARELDRAGLDVHLFEAQARWGGLAQTFRDNGYLYDFGPHYITNRLARQLDILDDCVHVPYAESIHHRGRFYSFPFGLMRNPLFAFQAGIGMLRSSESRKSCHTAAEFFRVSYGPGLTRRILGPLVSKWSGVDPEALSVDFVDRVPPPSVGVLLRKLLGVVTRRSIQTMPNQGIVYHVTPREGIQLLSDTLAAPLVDRISLSSPVERILVRDGQIDGVVIGGERHECDAVVSTLPAPLLPDLIDGTDALEPLRNLRFRPILLAFLQVHRPHVLDRLLTWFPDRHHLFYRLSEQKLAYREVAPPDSTLLTIEMTCNESDTLWTLPEDQLRHLLVDQIGEVYDLPSDAFGSMRLLRTRFGYPMYDLEQDEVRKSLELEAAGAGIEGLHLVGRTGSFRYILLEESHRLAVQAAQRMLTPAERERAVAARR